MPTKNPPGPITLSLESICQSLPLTPSSQVAPLALLVEKAGGHSSADGKCISGLDVEIKQYDQRTQICFGSIKEVARFEKMLYGKSERFAKEEQLVA